MNHPVFLRAGPAWAQVEAGTGVHRNSLPLFHRLPWVQHHHGSQHALLALHDSAGRLVPQAAMQIDRSRLLPGHHILRVLRFGHGLAEEAWEPAIAALADLARHDARALRLHIGVFSRQHRAEIAATLARYGFKAVPHPQSYRHTLTVDLQPEPEAIFDGLHKTARKNLRSVDRSPLSLQTLTDDIYADRLASLQSASMLRTGGKAAAMDWRSILQLSGAHPELSRVVGLFSSPSNLHPDALLGFGWGCMHGDHGEYRSAGTALQKETNLPLSYPLLWNLILWAKEQGGTWFDLGGVSLGDVPNDPLAGISDFKRYFSRTVEEVGEEWVLEPHPGRSYTADLIGRGLHRSARVLGLLSSSRNASPRHFETSAVPGKKHAGNGF